MPSKASKKTAAQSNQTPNSQPFLQPLKRMIGGLETPDNLFKGLQISSSLSPDNIICFERTDISEFRPEGVSNNFHHRFELLCVIEGKGPARIGDNTYNFEPGDCALIFPNQFHHYMDVKAESLDWLFVTFDLANAEGLEALQNAPRKLDPESVIILQNILYPYLSKKGDDADTLEISYYLSRFLKHMTQLNPIPAEQCTHNSTEDTRDMILQKINHYVRDHLSEAPTIADLADSLNYSVSHLRAVFRDSLGISLGLYIRESRLSEAAKLLKNSDLNVTEISKRTGFDSLYAFSRAFKNTYGISPKAYSKKLNSTP